MFQQTQNMKFFPMLFRQEHHSYKEISWRTCIKMLERSDVKIRENWAITRPTECIPLWQKLSVPIATHETWFYNPKWLTWSFASEVIVSVSDLSTILNVAAAFAKYLANDIIDSPDLDAILSIKLIRAWCVRVVDLINCMLLNAWDLVEEFHV